MNLDRYADYDQMDDYPTLSNALGPYSDDATPVIVRGRIGRYFRIAPGVVVEVLRLMEYPKNSLYVVRDVMTGVVHEFYSGNVLQAELNEMEVLAYVSKKP